MIDFIYLFDVEDGGELVVPDGGDALHGGEEVGGAEGLGVVVAEGERLQPLLHAQRGQLLFAQLWKEGGKVKLRSRCPALPHFQVEGCVDRFHAVAS